MNNLDTKDKVVGVFLLLFLITMIIIIANGRKKMDTVEKEKNDNNPITDYSGSSNNKKDETKDMYSGINNKNYNYTFKIVVGDTLETITGKVYNGKELFTIGQDTFRRENNIYYKLVDNKYEKISNTEIRDYYKYIDFNYIRKLINLSEKDKFEQNVYLVDIVDLINMYSSNTPYDPFEKYPSDKISYTLDENGYIKLLELNYYNYYSYINDKETPFNIVLEFSDYGKVEDFDF